MGTEGRCFECRTLTLKPGCGQLRGQASPFLGRRLSFATHACAVCERKKENRLIMSPCHRAQLEASLGGGDGLGLGGLSLPGGRVWGATWVGGCVGEGVLFQSVLSLLLEFLSSLGHLPCGVDNELLSDSEAALSSSR